jgi:hypothetical protein
MLLMQACLDEPWAGEQVTSLEPPRMAIRLSSTSDVIDPAGTTPGQQIHGFWTAEEIGLPIVLQAATWSLTPRSDGRADFTNQGFRLTFTDNPPRVISTVTTAIPASFFSQFDFEGSSAFRIPHCVPAVVNDQPVIGNGGQPICDTTQSYWRRFGPFLTLDPEIEDYFSRAEGSYPECNSSGLLFGMWTTEPYENCPRYVARLQAAAVRPGFPLVPIPHYIVVYADDVAPSTESG